MDEGTTENKATDMSGAMHMFDPNGLVMTAVAGAIEEAHKILGINTQHQVAMASVGDLPRQAAGVLEASKGATPTV